MQIIQIFGRERAHINDELKEETKEEKPEKEIKQKSLLEEKNKK